MDFDWIFLKLVWFFIETAQCLGQDPPKRYRRKNVIPSCMDDGVDENPENAHVLSILFQAVLLTFPVRPTPLVIVKISVFISRVVVR